jgi:hypothetical protein
MEPSHEMVPMRLGFADVLGAWTLGALSGLERHGLPLTERVERLARRLIEEVLLARLVGHQATMRTNVYAHCKVALILPIVPTR